jgi:mannose-6-phosphate isomerase-like protein (cupin superfamily)
MKKISSADLSFIPAGHESQEAPGVWKKVLFQRGDLQAGVIQMVNWAKLPAGKTFTPHFHEDMQEVYIMLNGAARLVVDEQTVILRRGDAVLIDPREVHQMWNDGDEDVEFLAIGVASGTSGRSVVVAEDD